MTTREVKVHLRTSKKMPDEVKEINIGKYKIEPISSNELLLNFRCCQIM